MNPTFAIYSLQSPHWHLVGIQVLIFDLKISTDGEFLKSLNLRSKVSKGIQPIITCFRMKIIIKCRIRSGITGNIF